MTTAAVAEAVVTTAVAANAALPPKPLSLV